jgi:nucleotide-binding universal stress UspA family protein
MATRAFPVLVATDGSPAARRAVEAAARFPWPERSHGHVLVARRVPVIPEWPMTVWEALVEADRAEARAAARRLRARWPAVEATVLDAPPVDAILRHARRLRARVIVLGSRGLGALGRLVLGSVSRGVVRQAPCAVLVVRGRLRRVRRLVVGIDGSAHARRAVDLVASLARPRGGAVRLLAGIEPVRLPSAALLPRAIRTVLASERQALEQRRLAAARRHLDAARARLAARGWRVRAEVRTGRPLELLLDAARAADVLVVGARGTAGVERLLLGSVAEGALARAPGAVLVVR